jgi:hypothetical protein
MDLATWQASARVECKEWYVLSLAEALTSQTWRIRFGFLQWQAGRGETVGVTYALSDC